MSLIVVYSCGLVLFVYSVLRCTRTGLACCSFDFVCVVCQNVDLMVTVDGNSAGGDTAADAVPFYQFVDINVMTDVMFTGCTASALDVQHWWRIFR